MCGFIGGWSKIHLSAESSYLEILDRIAHRGPDASGFISYSNVYFAHKRLAILGLNDNAKQPIVSGDNRYVMVFNGEIYNFRELASEFAADNKFAFESDTVLLLGLIEKIGINGSLKKIDGMYSVAILDRQDDSIYLARDVFGEKPLYFRHDCFGFHFSSELRCLVNRFSNESNINPYSAVHYFNFGYMPPKETIVTAVCKVLPGELLRFDIRSNNIEHFKVNQIRGDESFTTSEKLSNLETENLVEECLLDAVRSRMVSDVPTGLYLSGGIDSSLLAALTAKLGYTGLNCFSVGYTGQNFDETDVARKTATRFGHRFERVVLTDDDLLCGVEKIGVVFDEPFADVSALPTIALANLACKHVKVVLGGDGADELFYGYNRHVLGSKIHMISTLLHPRINETIAAGLESALVFELSSYLQKYGMLFGKGDVATKLSKVQRLFRSLDNDGMSKFISSGDAGKVMKEDYLRSLDDSYHDSKPILEFFTEMVNFDLENYLPNNILYKADRCSMSASIEARSPFLAKDLSNLAFSLRPDRNIRFLKGKKVLRNLAAKYLSEVHASLPKSGFEPPVADWLSGPLKNFALDQLGTTDHSGILDSRKISALRRQLQKGNFDSILVWKVICFMQWSSK